MRARPESPIQLFYGYEILDIFSQAVIRRPFLYAKREALAPLPSCCPRQPPCFACAHGMAAGMCDWIFGSGFLSAGNPALIGGLPARLRLAARRPELCLLLEGKRRVRETGKLSAARTRFACLLLSASPVCRASATSKNPPRSHPSVLEVESAMPCNTGTEYRFSA